MNTFHFWLITPNTNLNKKDILFSALLLLQVWLFEAKVRAHCCIFLINVALEFDNVLISVKFWHILFVQLPFKRMRWAAKYKQSLHAFNAIGISRQHSINSLSQHQRWISRKKIGKSHWFKAFDIATVWIVNLLTRFFAGDCNVLHICHHNVITLVL